jgi:hypothetical protein
VPAPWLHVFRVGYDLRSHIARPIPAGLDPTKNKFPTTLRNLGPSWRLFPPLEVKALEAGHFEKRRGWS